MKDFLDSNNQIGYIDCRHKLIDVLKERGISKDSSRGLIGLLKTDNIQLLSQACNHIKDMKLDYIGVKSYLSIPIEIRDIICDIYDGTTYTLQIANKIKIDDLDVISDMDKELINEFKGSYLLSDISIISIGGLEFKSYLLNKYALKESCAMFIPYMYSVYHERVIEKIINTTNRFVIHEMYKMGFKSYDMNNLSDYEIENYIKLLSDCRDHHIFKYIHILINNRIPIHFSRKLVKLCVERGYTDFILDKIFIDKIGKKPHIADSNRLKDIKIHTDDGLSYSVSIMLEHCGCGTNEVYERLHNDIECILKGYDLSQSDIDKYLGSALSYTDKIKLLINLNTYNHHTLSDILYTFVENDIPIHLYYKFILNGVDIKDVRHIITITHLLPKYLYDMFLYQLIERNTPIHIIDTALQLYNKYYKYHHNDDIKGALEFYFTAYKTQSLETITDTIYTIYRLGFKIDIRS